jgi:hypothetical protein
MLALALAACADPDLPGSLVVITRQDDGSYALAPRDRAGLRDPRRLVGDVGHGWRGGRLDTAYHQGGALDIRWALDHGDAVPLDEDGLVLWSFWYHLDDGRAALEDHGLDPSPIFPVDIAWTPQSVLDFSAVENAAYLLGQKTFVLFPDALDEVPLAANAGVVRHELGHAVFELVTTGTVGGTIPWLDSEDYALLLRLRALNEGFADMNATLLLDDPRFLDASLILPERDVDGDAVATADLYPPDDAGLADSLTYDPYALGTVFASFVWDVRLATDADTAYALAIDALTAYGLAADWADIDGFVRAYVAAGDDRARSAACSSARVRFPDLDLTAECP